MFVSKRKILSNKHVVSNTAEVCYVRYFDIHIIAMVAQDSDIHIIAMAAQDSCLEHDFDQ